MYIAKKEEAEKEIKQLETEINALSTASTTTETPTENIAERLSVLQDAMVKYADFNTENDVPDNIIDAFVKKVVVSKDGFDWYLRYAPENALYCNVEGRKGKANVSFASNTPFTSPQHRMQLRK